MRLHVLRESFLRHEVEFCHGIGERLSVHPQRGNQAQHGTVKRSIDLRQRLFARVVHVDDKNVTQKALHYHITFISLSTIKYHPARNILYSQCSFANSPMRQWFATRVSWRIASTDKLDAFQFNPRLVRSTIKASMLNYLTKEGNHTLCSILVQLRQVDLIAEQHEPLVQLYWSQHKAVGRLAILAIMVKCLQQKLWGRCTRKVQANHLQH
jgi:hypothetical protein